MKLIQYTCLAFVITHITAFTYASGGYDPYKKQRKRSRSSSGESPQSVIEVVDLTGDDEAVAAPAPAPVLPAPLAAPITEADLKRIIDEKAARLLPLINEVKERLQAIRDILQARPMEERRELFQTNRQKALDLGFIDSQIMVLASHADNATRNLQATPETLLPKETVLGNKSVAIIASGALPKQINDLVIEKLKPYSEFNEYTAPLAEAARQIPVDPAWEVALPFEEE
jgi:hypothetical protein